MPKTLPGAPKTLLGGARAVSISGPAPEVLSAACKNATPSKPPAVGTRLRRRGQGWVEFNRSANRSREGVADQNTMCTYDENRHLLAGLMPRFTLRSDSDRLS